MLELLVEILKYGISFDKHHTAGGCKITVADVYLLARSSIIDNISFTGTST
jgi:hypothetical protein